MIQIDEAIPGLYASAPQSLPFAPTLDIRAFLLQRDQGNLLVYSVSEIDFNDATIRNLGGIARQYMNHRHEAMFAAEKINAPLFCHVNEKRSIAKKATVDETFSERQMLDEDFEIIPTPGHTTGATSFLWNCENHRILFTGDTMFLSDGQWIAAILDSSDRALYIESLELIRELDFNVLVPWAATKGQPCHAMTDKPDARRRINAILDRARRGEDH